jgi:DNA-binding NarL/FixJ family response regulator
METSSKEKSRCPLRVYLVVENRLMREALARVFQKQSNLCVVGESSSREVTPTQVMSVRTDIVLLDSLDTEAAEELADELLTAHSRIRIILFGMEDDAECFVRAVREGVAGYLLKETSSEELVSAVRSVGRGEAVCPSKLCMALFERVAQEQRQRSGMADEEAGLKLGLTFRQRQLVALIAKGMSNKEIASNLNLSECTVKNHVYRIMKHVEAESRQDAVDLIRSRACWPVD